MKTIFSVAIATVLLAGCGTSNIPTVSRTVSTASAEDSTLLEAEATQTGVGRLLDIEFRDYRASHSLFGKTDTYYLTYDAYIQTNPDIPKEVTLKFRQRIERQIVLELPKERETGHPHRLAISSTCKEGAKPGQSFRTIVKDGNWNPGAGTMKSVQAEMQFLMREMDHTPLYPRKNGAEQKGMREIVNWMMFYLKKG